jgi:hypothetical protein
MEDLIKSLQIFSKYFDAKVKKPTHCEHDVLMLVVASDSENVSIEDAKTLKKLGWFWNGDYWCSYRFGSA